MTAPTPPEVREAVVLEEVARAIFAADGFTGPPWEDDVEGNREDYRRLAAAAVAACRAQDGGAEEAVRRVEALAESWLQSPIPIWTDKAAALIRAALAPQAGDGAR